MHKALVMSIYINNLEGNQKFLHLTKEVKEEEENLQISGKSGKLKQSSGLLSVLDLASSTSVEGHRKPPLHPSHFSNVPTDYEDFTSIPMGERSRRLKNGRIN